MESWENIPSSESSRGAWAVVQDRGDAGINGGTMQGSRGGRGIGLVGEGRPWKQLFLRWGHGGGHGVVFPERSSAKTQMFLPPGPHQGPHGWAQPLSGVSSGAVSLSGSQEELRTGGVARWFMSGHFYLFYRVDKCVALKSFIAGSSI